MIIDMVSVNIMQTAIMHVIKVVAMRDHEMLVPVAMHMIGVERRVENGFAGRVLRTDFQHVLIHMPIMDEVEVTVMQIVPMVDMPDPRVAAIFAMDVSVVGVNTGIMRVRGEAAAGGDGQNGA